MAKRQPRGDVAWYLPDAKKGSKPIAYSTIATSDLIVLLYQTYGDLRRVYEEINYDTDAKRIVEEYLKRSIYHINIK